MHRYIGAVSHIFMIWADCRGLQTGHFRAHLTPSILTFLASKILTHERTAENIEPRIQRRETRAKKKIQLEEQLKGMNSFGGANEYEARARLRLAARDAD